MKLKKNLGLMMLVPMTMAISSCGDQLDALPGLWEGTPTTIGSVSQMNSTASVSMEFTTDPGDGRTGDVTLRAIINTEQATVPQFDGMVASYALDVASTATIKGKYVVVDDDEVMLTLDPASLKVNIDPEGVRYQSNVFTEEQKPVVDSLMPYAVAHLKAVISPQISKEFLKYARIDDVKIKDNRILSCEIDDRDYTFRRIEME